MAERLGRATTTTRALASPPAPDKRPMRLILGGRTACGTSLSRVVPTFSAPRQRPSLSRLKRKDVASKPLTDSPLKQGA